jgi:diketogulonate reductase-like aldo/keto reductase
MNTLSDYFTLHNGVHIPCIGFGTWLVEDGAVAQNAVRAALEAGYRHIDTAAAYGNERSVGKAVRESGIPRKDLFVTSKLWNTERGYESTLRAFSDSLSALGLAYMDLYLIHWPAQGEAGVAVNVDTWRALEQLYKEGLVRAIGVSNFLVHHLQPLMERAVVRPMVNQIEYHPGQTQPEVVAFCREQAILVEAWGPLGRGKMLSDARLVALAEKYHRSVAQLCIRWCLQGGVLPLPKSVQPARMAENAGVFDFTIADQDMAAIAALPYFGGSGLHPDEVDF